MDTLPIPNCSKLQSFGLQHVASKVSPQRNSTGTAGPNFVPRPVSQCQVTMFASVSLRQCLKCHDDVDQISWGRWHHGMHSHAKLDVDLNDLFPRLDNFPTKSGKSFHSKSEKVCVLMLSLVFSRQLRIGHLRDGAIFIFCSYKLTQIHYLFAAIAFWRPSSLFWKNLDFKTISLSDLFWKRQSVCFWQKQHINCPIFLGKHDINSGKKLQISKSFTTHSFQLSNPSGVVVFICKRVAVWIRNTVHNCSRVKVDGTAPIYCFIQALYYLYNLFCWWLAMYFDPAVHLFTISQR